MVLAAAGRKGYNETSRARPAFSYRKQKGFRYLMNSKAHKKFSFFKIIACILGICLLLAVLAAGVLYLKLQEPGKRSADFARLQQEAYQGIFCSMYAPEAFPEDIYSTYMGYDAVSCSHRITSFSDLSDYLNTAFSSGNEVSHVFLVLDPLILWNSSLHNSERFNDSLDTKLLSYIDACPDAEFTIFFSTPSLAYWQSQSAKELETYENMVNILASSLSMRENAAVFFPGGEEWLISNPDAYASPLELNATAARSVMMLVLSGALRYQNTDTCNSLAQYDTLVQHAVSSPASYPDLSDYDIVFFGDSVFGNYHDFASIPGVIGALTKAAPHNLAVGGSSATQISAGDKSFPSAVQHFLSGDNASLSEGKKLCFIINYGLNDYFTGYTVEDYEKGLQAGVQSLQEAYPDAEILIVSPNFIISFEYGTAHNNDFGEILADYVAAAEAVAGEQKVDFLNANEVLQWNAQNAAGYLVDAIHPNEEGRFLLGVAIIKALEEVLP